MGLEITGDDTDSPGRMRKPGRRTLLRKPGAESSVQASYFDVQIAVGKAMVGRVEIGQTYLIDRIRDGTSGRRLKAKIFDALPVGVDGRKARGNGLHRQSAFDGQLGRACLAPDAPGFVVAMPFQIEGTEI